MMPSRRQVVLSLAASVPLKPQLARSATPIPRAKCFFGLHFDLHPVPEDKALGADVTENMIESLLRSVKPDFVEYDSKGHPGYLGFPSKTGMSAPHIVRDSLAIWRGVTSRFGVALYNHFSGLLDGLAVTKHPDWARIDDDGKRSERETSLFSAYERDLMIPELVEAATRYQLDGSWVDGDCWAVEPDYCESAITEFRAQTGITAAPRKPGDPGWNEWLELQRERFRRYVSNYVTALHDARRGYQITSNWMYSTFVPEQPAIALDYLSGDIADQAPVQRARIEARYFASCGKTWDLMSWGFETDPHFGHMSHKPAVALEQEAANVIAQGGAYQIYYSPTRTGKIDERMIGVAAEVAAFCRERQHLSHGSESFPEATVLLSRRSLYRDGQRVFGPWGRALAPLEGAVDALIACGYSTDILPDWRDSNWMARYPLLVVPDWSNLGNDIADRVCAYAKSGGNLLLCGAANAELFADTLRFQVSAKSANKTYFVAGESGFAAVEGSWTVLQDVPSATVMRAFSAVSTDAESIALGVRRACGKGFVVVCPGPLMTEYEIGRTPILRDAVRQLTAGLHSPSVTVEPTLAALEVVLRRRNDSVIAHFINLENAPVTGEFRHPGFVPPTGPLQVRVRLASAPTQVTLEPGGTALQGDYVDGVWRGILPNLAIHSLIRFGGVR